MDQQNSKYFNKTHLNEETIAMVAEALAFDKMNKMQPEILNHIEDCLQCKKEIFSVYGLIKNEKFTLNNIPHESKETTHKKKTDSTKFYIYDFLKIASVFLLLVSLIILINYLSGNKVSPINAKFQIVDSLKKDNLSENQNINNTPIASATEINIQKDISGNSLGNNDDLIPKLKESEIFENLISSNYRGTNIEVLSPDCNQKFTAKQKITFKFKGDLSIPITIIIYNNSGKEIFRKSGISTNSYDYSPTLSLGLYYWKLIQEDNLMYVGKFFIK